MREEVHRAMIITKCDKQINVSQEAGYMVKESKTMIPAYVTLMMIAIVMSSALAEEAGAGSYTLPETSVQPDPAEPDMVAEASVTKGGL